ncbi:MAG: hypothetical protein E7580_08675 [Ruminococcaceae bacterium]|nr:hypothetical protein [Oscillospiraceae bacterium]
MKRSTVAFLKKVAITTVTAFSCVTMTFLAFQSLMFNLGEYGTPTSELQTINYLFIKLCLAVFPFSLCLGFAARIFDTKKPRAYQRLLHFLACMAAYVVFMVLVFDNAPALVYPEIQNKILLSTYIKHSIPFFIFYPVTAGINALGRAVFTPAEDKKEMGMSSSRGKKKKKSILD